jgi:hypothetical protein
MFREKSPDEKALAKKKANEYREDESPVVKVFRELTPKEKQRRDMCIEEVVGDLPDGKLFIEDRMSKYPKWFIDPRLEIKESPGKGLGVFATAPIKMHDLIESAPVIVCSHATFTYLSEEFCPDGMTRHILSDYPFNWAEAGSACRSEVAFSLGWGGIYNHSSFDPNIFWRPNLGLPSLEFWAKRDIEAGEEVCSRYCPIGGLDNLWFDTEDYESGGSFTMRKEKQFIGHVGSWDAFTKK